MQARTQVDKLVVRAPAKLNLFLEVLGKRADGYHEIASVLQEISLCDQLTFKPCREGFHLHCTYPGLPAGDDNLIVRAAGALADRLGETRGAEIELTKRIPIGAGLGGASSDAAATLMGLAKLWQQPVNKDTFIELTQSLGSDVPFFLYGGSALCRGRGEKVTPLNLSRRLHFVLVCPSRSASTQAVYKNVSLPLTNERQDIEYFLEVWKRKSLVEIGQHLFNRLESSALQLYPYLAEVRKALEQAGAWAVCMSGSGSTYFGLCPNKEEAVRLKGRLSCRDIGEVLVAESRP